MKLVMEENPPVEIRGLQKAYGALPVLTGLDLSLGRGETTAVIGPNAAGKTTLIKCILGLVRPKAGRILVGGRDVAKGIEYRRFIGYMPQKASFPENLSGRDVIELIQSIRPDAPAPDLTLVRRLELEKDLDKPVRALSGGTLQKLSAVLAFMFSPGLYILDEPTAGLDPVASATLKDHIRHITDSGGTVLLTSHVMADLEELCDRVVFLLDGRIRYDGSLSSILSDTGEHRLERAIARLLKSEAA
jgi:Cu-processing system ATP-binding protein